MYVHIYLFVYKYNTCIFISYRVQRVEGLGLRCFKYIRTGFRVDSLDISPSLLIPIADCEKEKQSQ